MLTSLPTSISGTRWAWRAADCAADAYFRPDDLVTQMLLNRGCTRELLELHRAPTLRALMPDPSVFADMERAARRLADAVEARETITIFGDYDVDGATSAALLIRLIRMLGHDADAYIPDRLMEGYGPTGDALVRLAEAGSTLIVTVDCGAQAFDALETASAAGIDIVVVDHHQCATSLPKALALVNPNRLDESEAGAVHGNLAAVGVAFLLGAAVIRELRTRGYFVQREEPKLVELLDIVALGTVADVASLRGLNRAFVAQGLKVMAARRNVGLSALVTAARLTRAPTCSDLGFALGPRINAGGRVGKADLGVRLLTTEDAYEAEVIALELDRLNSERRMIEADVQAEAEILARAQSNKPVILVAASGWHAGVIGIVAGRLKEKFHKPAFVIALDAEGIGKGSARSIAAVDLGAAVLAAKDNGLLVAGGGHKMAAGLTVRQDAVALLHEFLCERLQEDVARAMGEHTLLIDTLVAPAGLTPAFVETLEAAGPYGMGWPAPRVAVAPVRIMQADRVGVDHVRLTLAGGDGKRLKAVAFRQADTLLGQTLLAAPRDRALWVVGRPKIDDWGGRMQADLHIEDAAWAD